METFAEAWVAANTQTAVNAAEQQVRLRQGMLANFWDKSLGI
jgi:hypothetical protein